MKKQTPKELLQKTQRFITNRLPDEWTEEETTMLKELQTLEDTFELALSLLHEQYETLTHQDMLTEYEESWCTTVESFLNKNNYVDYLDSD